MTPERPVNRAPPTMLTAAERRHQPALADPLPARACAPVCDAVRAAVRRDPQAPALDLGGRQWSYGTLAGAVSAIVRCLAQGDLTRGEVVAVQGSKEFGTVAAMVAVLEAGGVVLPLDADFPLLRREAMVSEAQARQAVVVGDSVVPGGVRARRLARDGVGARAGSSPARPRPTPSDPAYIFFTSGTTGRPKGIVGSHQGLSHFVQWEAQEFAIGPGDRVAQITTISFDAVLRDIFVPLTTGATICLPSPADLTAMTAWLDREKVTVVHTTPSVLSSWLAEECQVDAGLERLRLICLSGEPLHGSLVRRWREAFPDCHAEVVNFYGPTETTMIKTFHRVDADPPSGPQVIGRPLPDTQVLVMRRGGGICGPGERGEIVIRTPFRTLGYLDGGVSDGGFRANPYRKDPDDLLYWTGDAGRATPDGSIEVLGRLDREVKVRGVRVNPAEVAEVLRTHPAVAAVHVVSYAGSSSETALAAFVVPRHGACVTSRSMREHAVARLPRAMVPTLVREVPAIPLKPNGKVNEEALLEVAQQRHPRERVPPRTETERRLARLWESTLDVEPIGVSDDFFELGGHSLLATHLVGCIRAEFGTDLPLRRLFEAPTIAQLARALDERASGTAPARRSARNR